MSADQIRLLNRVTPASASLRLYVWGPAFGLASIDPECLAAIAYFAHAVEPQEYELVASSPSAVPTNHLPALHNVCTGTWASGFQAVLGLLHTSADSEPGPHGRDDGPGSGNNGTGMKSSSRSLDAKLNLPAPTTADLTAHTAFLTLHASPLLALSLYVSSANWTGATRPAFTALLPFPLGWTEPPARRRAMARKAEHLGLDDLDTDRVEEGGDRQEAIKKSFIPQRLRPRFKATGVTAALNPEAKARIRLEAAASSVLDVLASAVGVKAGDGGLGDGCMCGPWTEPAFKRRRNCSDKGHDEANERLGRSQRPPSAFECLSFGYLSLMSIPSLPRPWLREVMETKYPALCTFVSEARAVWFGSGSDAYSSSTTDGPYSLPWVTDDAGTSLFGVAARFANGTLLSSGFSLLPGGGLVAQLGAALGAYHPSTAVAASSGSWRSNSDLLTILCTSLVGASVAGAVVLYRSLQPFGLPVQQFERERRGRRIGMGDLGALGEALGFTGQYDSVG